MGCATSTPPHVEIEQFRRKPKDIKTQTVQEASKVKTSLKELYDVRERLGKGSFAEVCVCVERKTQAQHAVKILKVHNAGEKTKAERELDVWRRLGTHRNIVELMDSYVEADTFYFVMPQCSCSIAEVLKQSGNSISHNFMFDTIHQLFLGLQHCHASNIIHRDIKAANLLVDLAGNVRIADFGLSVEKPADGTCGLVGSVPYMSPEMVKGKHYGFETDIWSSGVVIYTSLYGRYPYGAATSNDSITERKRQIAEAIATNNPHPNYEPKGSIAPPSLVVRKFIEKLLQRNPTNRPDASLCARLCCGLKDAYESERDPKGHLELNFKEEHERTEASMATTCPADGASNSFPLCKGMMSYTES